MDYKKLYEEALERAREFVCKDNVEVAEYIFPELKENEDEKIRKALIKYFSEGREYLSLIPYNKEECVSWLEKQVTPQVRTGIEWVNTIDDACDKRYSEEYSHGEYCHEQSFKWGFQEDVDWLEKQDEQKSTKWSEEDNEMIFKICQNLYDYPRVKSPFDRESFNEAEKEVQFIKSIRPQNQWKPTEEQMKALAEALSLAKNCGEESAFDLRTLYEQLKNL